MSRGTGFLGKPADSEKNQAGVQVTTGLVGRADSHDLEHNPCGALSPVFSQTKKSGARMDGSQFPDCQKTPGRAREGRRAVPGSTCYRRTEHEIGNHRFEFPISSYSMRRAQAVFCDGILIPKAIKQFLADFTAGSLSTSSKIRRGWQWRGSLLPLHIVSVGAAGTARYSRQGLSEPGKKQIRWHHGERPSS